MKVKPVYWIALALALALTVAVCDGLRVKDKYSVTVGMYQEALAQVGALNIEQDKKITDAQKQITLQTAKIAELLGNAGKPSPAEQAKDATIVEQESEIARLKAQGDYKAALEQSQAENRAWAEKFTLAEERHKTELFDLNAAWQGKYGAAVTISVSWKQKYENELHLRTLAEKGWKAAERKLKWTRVLSNVKTGTIIAAAGYIIFNAVKGGGK